MGAYSFESEIASGAPHDKMYKALILESDTLLPQLIPNIQSSEIIEGDGGPGSIRKITFNEGGQIKYVKHKVEALDKENCSFSYSMIDGELALKDKVEKIRYDSKFVPTPEGGCVCKTTTTYYTKGDIELKEEEVKGGKRKAAGLFKAVEAYISKNPDY